MSQQFCIQHNIDNVYSHINCVSCDQLCVIPCSGCDDTDYKVLDNCVLYNGDINPCIDSNKEFDTHMNEHVSNDTIF